MTATTSDSGSRGFPLERGRLLSIPDEIGAADRQAITSKVEKLLRQAREAFPEWSPPPFDPQTLAEGLGMPIHYTFDLRGADALIVNKNGAFHILADASVRNFGRLNFTLAHEIAHTFFEGAADKIHLRSQDRAIYDRSPEGQTLERLCDIAAAELLMPPSGFNPVAVEAGFNAQALGSLASRFHVSLQAAAIRMVRWRSPDPVAVGFFEYGLPPSANRSADLTAYRVGRVFRSTMFPFLFPKGKSVPAESVIYRCSLTSGKRMLEARELFALRDKQRLLEVTAMPLERRNTGGEPPTVCATFRAV